MASARKLDRRTVAICVCVALIGALMAALVATALLSEDGSTSQNNPGGTLELEARTSVSGATILAAKVTGIEGDETSLGKAFGQKPMLVNFWQSSCAPCIKEMPLLEQAHLDNPQITVVGVDTMDQLAAAMKMVEQTKITYPWVQDLDGTVFLAANGAGLPTTLLIDGNGEVMASKTGAFADLEEIQAFIDQDGD